MTESKIIVALDFSDIHAVEQFIEPLTPAQCRLKVGKELFTRSGPVVVELLGKRGFDVFLDLKYHDIPNTVAQACRVAADLGVWMVNVHALGGQRMLSAAKESLATVSQPPLLIAVTVLTSMAAEDLAGIGIQVEPLVFAQQLAALAQAAELDGVVCSAQEAAAMKTRFGADFQLVTPGIRLANDDKGDQRRVMTPVDAVSAGADYLVMGRSITAAVDPVATLLAVNADIAALGTT